jgi:glutathionyl-hydroquinone reductase
MGGLVDGKWQRGEVASTSSSGHFERPETTFRNWITEE